MAVRFTNKGRTIVYRKGQSRLDVIAELEKRIAKRQKELDKRRWIVDEYNSLLSKQAEDRSWVIELNKWSDEKWNEGEK